MHFDYNDWDISSPNFLRSPIKNTLFVQLNSNSENFSSLKFVLYHVQNLDTVYHNTDVALYNNICKKIDLCITHSWPCFLSRGAFDNFVIVRCGWKAFVSEYSDSRPCFWKWSVVTSKKSHTTTTIYHILNSTYLWRASHCNTRQMTKTSSRHFHDAHIKIHTNIHSKKFFLNKIKINALALTLTNVLTR